jgi:two-component sensor histidine kinase
MEDAVSARNQLLAVALANDMATFLNGYLLSLSMVGSESFWTQEATEILSLMYPAFSSVLLVDTSGQVEFASMSSRERLFDVSNRDFFLATRDSSLPYLSPIFIAEGDYAPTAVMAVPGSIGLAVAYLNLEAIGEYIKALPIQGAETIAIVDHHGYYVAHRDARFVADRSSVALEGWYRDQANLKAGSQRVQKSGEPERLICWAPVTGPSGWTVIVSEDTDSVFAQLRLLRASVVVLVAGISLVAMAMILSILQAFDRDIKSLRAHTAEVAGGNYDTSFHYRGFKDLAPLANDYREAVAAVKEREQRIQENERRLEGILDFMPVPVIVLNRQATVFHINRAVTRTFGWFPIDLPDLRTWWIHMYPDEDYRKMAQDHWAGHLAILFAGEVPADHFEGELACRNGQSKKVVGDTAVFGDWIVVNFVDVSDAKDAEARMAANLREKEILLKEIHHRVKNNLQLIISLLNLKAQASGMDEGAFTESIDRVRVMATIHELLYESHDFSRIDLGEYIHTIVDWISASYMYGPVRPQLVLELETIDLDIDSAIPCGLIINELFTNAIKYAFDSTSADPVIRILTRTTSDGFVELVFADNGKGLPPDMEPDTVQSLGLQLIVSLSDQLRGHWHLSRAGGTSWNIKFPWG